MKYNGLLPSLYLQGNEIETPTRRGKVLLAVVSGVLTSDLYPREPRRIVRRP